jgi:asparagine synthase (glutamine-hydrolysing)
MANTLARRGPDAAGVHLWSGAALAHRRLAIFDLSPAGHQPMLSADGRVGIVFNGAIYNFPELRSELESSGIRFRSRTDTEVLLEGYRRWGIDALVSRIQGMFAFAIWDDDTQRLSLVRDRLGVKPLVYCQAGNGIAFASTVRALHAAGFGGDVDDMAVADLLEYGYVCEERSIFRGISKLPAATILEFANGLVTTRAYWTPPTPLAEGAGGFEEAVQQTEALLLEATRRRLQADVPVGALLSGGVDSALVCWAVKKLSGDVTAYTVGTPGHPMDEAQDAASTAAEIGIRHKILPLEGDTGSLVNELVNAYGEPFACASALGMLRVSRAVATSSAKVLLTGDGGDDLFLGYGRHQLMRRTARSARWLPSGVTPVWMAIRGIVPQYGLLRRVTHLVDYAAGGLAGFLGATGGLPELRRHGLLEGRLLPVAVDARRMEWSVAAARRLLDDYLQYDLRHQFVAEYLNKVDGATMHYSLEARSPFLDTDLWEYAGRLPFEVRLHGGRLKAILRELTARHVSRRAASGSKRGFSIPVERWLVREWYPGVLEAFQASRLSSGGWIEGDALVRDLKLARRRGHAPLRLWYLYVLESWLRSQEEHRTSKEESASRRLQQVALGSA